MRTRVPRSYLALIGIALSLPSFQACTQTVAILTTEQHRVPASGNGSNPEALLPTPLQTYRLTPTDLATVGYARGILIDRCMRRFDLSYAQRPFAEVLQSTLSSELVAIGRIYGVTDQASAAVHGYGFPSSTNITSQLTGDTRDRGYLRVLHGNLNPRNREPASTKISGARVPHGGCAGEADRRIGQTNRNVSIYGLAHTLWIKNRGKLVTSAGYRIAIRDWTTCMATHGFRTTDPVSDQGDIAAIYGSRRAAGDDAMDGPPTNGEVVLAMTDVDCKRSVNLVERLDALSAQLDHHTIVANRSALERDLRRLDAQVTRSNVLLQELNH